jgi:hypothetical protein
MGTFLESPKPQTSFHVVSFLVSLLELPLVEIEAQRAPAPPNGHTERNATKTQSRKKRPGDSNTALADDVDRHIGEYGSGAFAAAGGCRDERND